MTSREILALRVQLPGFPGPTLDDEVRALFADGLGGVCLFGSNTQAGPDAVTRQTDTIRRLAPHAVIAVDEEGGDVTRLHATTGSPVLGASALGAVDDVGLTEVTGRIVGAELAAVGINLDLAPVADANTNPDNPVIGSRSFGADPDLVARHVSAWVTGLQDAGVSACAKHFPGHGDTAADSHLELPTVAVDLPTLVRRELTPFAAAVSAGAHAVMTSHIVVPAVDPELPATLSRPVLALLREQLGFRGAIVTDALDMAGASATRGIPEAAVLAIDAGADLLCLGASSDVALVRAIQAALVEAVESGRLPEERLYNAVANVEGLPALVRASQGGHRSEAEPDEVEEQQLAAARRAVTVEGPLPRLAGAWIVSVTTAASIAVGEVPWGLEPDATVTPSGEWLEGQVTASDAPVVLQVRDAHRHAGVSSLVTGLSRGRRPVVVVEWGWPGPLEVDVPVMWGRGSSRPTVRAVTELLRAAGWDR
jgi:beta-N-acetylhexosaminidase